MGKKEIELFGQAHLQTVSFYGTSLLNNHHIASMALRHPALDFATIHFYDDPAIDRPKNTIDAAIITGKLTREVLSEINDSRPFFDTEHGPIFTFNNRRVTLSEKFDDEYFHNMQWSHFASGGAGGGMRWPYRNPHTLTVGMRKRQHSLSKFVQLIEWKKFKRDSLNQEITFSSETLIPFSCGNEAQAVIWLLRNSKAASGNEIFKLNFSNNNKYDVLFWNTVTGKVMNEITVADISKGCPLPSFEKDIAIYIRRN